MPAERVYAHPGVAADVGRVALRRGPLVYCLEEVDNSGGSVQRLVLPRASALTAEPRGDMLDGIVTVTADAFRLGVGDWNGTLYRPGRAGTGARPHDRSALLLLEQSGSRHHDRLDSRSLIPHLSGAHKKRLHLHALAAKGSRKQVRSSPASMSTQRITRILIHGSTAELRFLFVEQRDLSLVDIAPSIGEIERRRHGQPPETAVSGPSAVATPVGTSCFGSWKGRCPLRSPKRGPACR